jgi:hypothetical protein
MSIRIRVYPQYGGLNTMGGLGGFGMNRMGAVSAATYYQNKLQSQQQISNLQLGYERALWQERLQKVQLEERLKNPYAVMSAGYGAGYGSLPMASAYNPYASSMIGSSLLGSSGFFGSLGLGGMF